MSRKWQLQEAKNKFSEVVEAARTEGPQTITKRGAEAVVIISCNDYRKLRLERKNLVDFFCESPLVGVDLDLTRDASAPRADIKL